MQTWHISKRWHTYTQRASYFKFHSSNFTILFYINSSEDLWNSKYTLIKNLLYKTCTYIQGISTYCGRNNFFPIFICLQTFSFMRIKISHSVRIRTYICIDISVYVEQVVETCPRVGIRILKLVRSDKIESCNHDDALSSFTRCFTMLC